MCLRTLEYELAVDEPRPGELVAIEQQEEERIVFDERLLLDGLLPSGTITKIAEGADVREGAHKEPGGLVRATVAVRDGVVDGIVLSGDFFMEPAKEPTKLQDSLVGVAYDDDSVLGEDKAHLATVDAAGLDATDITKAVMAERQARG